jgi:thiol-disulfide isomerase/thioredoxin
VRSYQSQLCILLLPVLALCGCANNASTAIPDGADFSQLNQTAPDLSLLDLNGKRVKLSDYRGKTVLLDFWATWCGPCKIEEPWLVEFQRTYGQRKFSVVGVAMDEENSQVVKRYVDERRLNFPVLLGDDSVFKLYKHLDGWPTTLLIDRTGKIISTHVGVGSKREFEKEIEKALS